MSPYIVTSINVDDDVDALSKVMMTAFLQDPHWALNFPGMATEEVVEGCAQRLAYNLYGRRHANRHLKVIDAATNEVVGYARWILPPSATVTLSTWPDAQILEPTPEQLAQAEARWKKGTTRGRPKGLNRGIVDELSPALERAEAAIMRDEEFFSLDYLTVAPEHQGRGIAGQLIRSGLAQADAAGIRTLVMASTAAGRRAYEKEGFREVDRVSQSDEKWGGPGMYTNYFMLRDVGATVAV